MTDDPIKRFVRLVLFQAQQDHATELVISSAIGDTATIKYKVDGAWYDIPPPPSHILPEVVAELRRMAKLSEGVNKGVIDLDFSGVRVRWSATETSGASGFILKPQMIQAPVHLKVSDEIELRHVEEQYAQEIFDLADANRQHLRKWLPWLDQTRSVADTSAFIDSCSKQFSENGAFQAGIWYKRHLCGMIGHHGIDWRSRSTSMGYWLDASHQGKGIMTASCRVMINHAFSELDLHRIVIRCATENHRSRAIPERLGFALEGVARQSEWLYDHFVDLAIYGLLRSDKQT